MRYRYQGGEITDENGTMLLRIMEVNASKKFRNRVGKTLVGILNEEERGKEIVRARQGGQS